MRFSFRLATANDSAELAELHTTVAGHLTAQHGQGPWSAVTTEERVRSVMRTSRVFVARQGARIAGTLRLTNKKPWAIDTSYFSKSRKPVYLLGMAVLPAMQGQGIGRRCLEEVRQIARGWPADA